MTGPFTAAVIALLLSGLQIEARALTDQLRKEAAEGSGAILPPEVDILSSPRRRLAERVRVLGKGGLRAYVALARLQTAQLDLAMERWHRDRNEMEDPLEAEHELRQRAIDLRRRIAA